MRWRIFLVIPLICIMASLSCNLPASPAPSLPGDSAEQTMMAILFPPTAISRSETPSPDQNSSDLKPSESNPQAQWPLPELRTLSPDEAYSMTLQPPEIPFTYLVQAGDTLIALSKRFGVQPEQIQAEDPLLPDVLLPPGLALTIQVTGMELISTPVASIPIYPGALLPDSEVIYSPSAIDFDVKTFAREAGGYLSTYQEELEEQWVSGPELLQRVALENSINPRLLLALLEYQSGWVYGQPVDSNRIHDPLGFQTPSQPGLYLGLSLAVRQLTRGYYGWRSGDITELKFKDGTKARLSPQLNAGSIAVQTLFAQLYSQRDWLRVLYGKESFPLFYQRMLGDPWARAARVEPLYTETLQQPTLELPFLPGEVWSLTGGPHNAWGISSAQGGLDFAPASSKSGCFVSPAWATAAASGLVVRSAHGVLVIDLDGDGYEQTGWNLVYLHLAEEERLPVGTWVKADDRLGHPSCEGGVASGTHLHLSRKYNGEWLAAGPPLPFVLSGWTARPGERPYKGFLVKDNQVVTARSDGSHESLISR